MVTPHNTWIKPIHVHNAIEYIMYNAHNMYCGHIDTHDMQSMHNWVNGINAMAWDVVNHHTPYMDNNNTYSMFNMPNHGNIILVTQCTYNTPHDTWLCYGHWAYNDMDIDMPQWNTLIPINVEYIDEFVDHMAMFISQLI